MRNHQFLPKTPFLPPVSTSQNVNKDIIFLTEHLHLTPVSNLIHLRPQLHHIDAATQQERQSSAAAAAAANKDGAPATTSSARAIHMTIKTTSDGADGVSTETMADRLRAVQTEPWRKMRYTDENDETAWDVYNESLFLRPRADPTTTGEQQQQQAEADHDLEELVPTLGNKWDDTQFLESISGIKKPQPVPEPPAAEQKKPEPAAAAAAAATTTLAEEQRQPPRATRPRAGAAAAMAARRGGRSSKAA